MPESEHPPWCSAQRCTAANAPFNGTSTGAHYSRPEASGQTEVYLRQTPAAQVPAVELRRAGAALTLPLLEAQSLGPAVDDLLRQAGVGL